MGTAGEGVVTVATTPRCSCGRRITHGGRECIECECVTSNLMGMGPLRRVPIVKPEDLPRTAWCRFCGRANTPEYTDSMYRHDEGPDGLWWAHVGCESQREYDRYESWRDTRDEREDRS